MKRNEIIDTFKMLAKSQGFYGRLLRDLNNLEENDPVSYDDAMQQLEAQNFGDAVDLVMYIEG